MSRHDDVLALLDEALDAARYGELDDWTPFDPVDDMTLTEADRLHAEVKLWKNTLRMLEKWIQQRIGELVQDDGDEFTMRGQDFHVARFGPTVYAWRPKPTDPKVTDPVAFAEWAGNDLPRLARFELRKKQLRDYARECEVDIEVLVDTGLIEWEFPDAGKPTLEVIDLGGYQPPKWAERVRDRWEDNE